MELCDVPKLGLNQHPPPIRRPAPEGRRTDILVLPQPVPEGVRHHWYMLDGDRHRPPGIGLGGMQ